MKNFLIRICIGSNPKRTMVRVVFLAAASFVVFSYVFRPVLVDGYSMAPTVRDRSFHFANLRAYRNGPPMRGDIIVIDKDGFGSMYMKRVLGLPGETVSFEGGDLIIDGAVFNENYLADRGDWDMQPLLLGEDEYLVAGDNRTVPRRAHMMGIVELDAIRGKLVGGRVGDYAD